MPSPSPSPHGQDQLPARRRLWPLVLAAVVLLALIPVGPIFAPPRTPPTKVDAIMVLGPAEQSRIETAVALIEAGYADTLVVSTTRGAGTYGADKLRICTRKQTFTVYCVHPSPLTTQGEVLFLDRLAQVEGWETAMVVTFDPHVNRAELYLDRCFAGVASVISDRSPIDPGLALYEYAYQSVAFLKAFTITPGCAQE